MNSECVSEIQTLISNDTDLTPVWYMTNHHKEEGRNKEKTKKEEENFE